MGWKMSWLLSLMTLGESNRENASLIILLDLVVAFSTMVFFWSAWLIWVWEELSYSSFTNSFSLKKVIIYNIFSCIVEQSLKYADTVPVSTSIFLFYWSYLCYYHMGQAEDWAKPIFVYVKGTSVYTSRGGGGRWQSPLPKLQPVTQHLSLLWRIPPTLRSGSGETGKSAVGRSGRKISLCRQSFTNANYNTKTLTTRQSHITESSHYLARNSAPLGKLLDQSDELPLSPRVEKRGQNELGRRRTDMGPHIGHNTTWLSSPQMGKIALAT